MYNAVFLRSAIAGPIIGGLTELRQHDQLRFEC